MSEFSQASDLLSQKLKLIDRLTAKKEEDICRIKEKTNDQVTINGKLTFPFCRSTKLCEDKLIHKALRGHRLPENHYRLCTFNGLCNLQTTEKGLGLARLVSGDNGVAYYL